MENPMEVYIFNFNTFQDLALLEIGKQQCAPLYSFGPYIRNEYIFHYIISGKGYMSYSTSRDTSSALSDTIEIKAGEGFLLEPHTRHMYYADEKDPWHYIWVVFTGLSAPSYLRSYGLIQNNTIYRPKDYTIQTTTRLREHLLAIIKKPNASKAFIIGHFHLFFHALLENSAVPEVHSSADISIANLYISEATRYISNQYPNIRTLDEISSYCNITRSHLTRLFKNILHTSLQEYLTQHRINKAMELLINTDLPVYQISAQVGYENDLNFLRAFKKRTGVSPSVWRKQKRLRL